MCGDALDCPIEPGIFLPNYRSASATFPLAINSAIRAKSLYMTRSFSIVGTHRPDRGMRGLSALRGFQWSQEVDGLGHGHGFNRQHVARVFDNALQLVRRRHAHGNVVFLVARGSDRIHRRGMRQHFVLADQRGRRDLRHHETGIQSCAVRQERRQSFAERGIHQTLDPAFADSRERAERDGQKIQSKRERFAVKISAGDYVACRRFLASVMNTRGLSTAEFASISNTWRQCASVSRTAPCTCGMQRRE